MSILNKWTTRSLALVTTCSLTVGAFWSCGKNELRYGGPTPLPQSSLGEKNERPTMKVRYGTLELIENTIAKSGFVNYAIYQDGTISYEGAVQFLADSSSFAFMLGYFQEYYYDRMYQYTLSAFGIETTQPFRGAIKAKPASILSSSYQKIGTGVIDTKIQLKVVEGTEGPQRTLGLSFIPEVRNGWSYPTYGSPTDYNTSGFVHIDTSEEIIGIEDAELSARIFNMPITIKVKKYVVK